MRIGIVGMGAVGTAVKESWERAGHKVRTIDNAACLSPSGIADPAPETMPFGVARH